MDLMLNFVFARKFGFKVFVKFSMNEKVFFWLMFCNALGRKYIFNGFSLVFIAGC